MGIENWLLIGFELVSCWMISCSNKHFNLFDYCFMQSWYCMYLSIKFWKYPGSILTSLKLRMSTNINHQQNRNKSPLAHSSTSTPHTLIHATLLAERLRGSSRTPVVTQGNLGLILKFTQCSHLFFFSSYSRNKKKELIYWVDKANICD